MIIDNFIVYNYRNIKDSDWIDINKVTAFVGQNEAGKSNLFEALYRVNPFVEEATYDVDEDWPVNDWGNKGNNDVVCRVNFNLEESEVEDLFKHAAIQTSLSEEDKSVVSYEKPKDLFIQGIGFYKKSPFFVIDEEYYEVLDKDKVNEWSKENAPKFVYIDDYSMSGAQIELDHLKQKKQKFEWDKLTSEEQTILIILDLAKIDLDDFISKGSNAEGRTVRSFDKRQASAYLTQQFKDLWRQKKVRFDIDVDGTTLNIFVEDEVIGFPVRLNKRSTGFRWYVSFAWKFTHASKGEYKNCVLLLEEPGVHLHLDGQKDLLAVFNNLSDKNTILYTTHLASLVDLSYPERIRIVENPNGRARITSGVVSAQKDAMALIELSLGLTSDLSSLYSNRKTLIVEGGDDALILHKLSGVLNYSGMEGLSDHIYLWTAKGAPNTPMYAGYAVGNKWDSGVLLDTDQAGLDAKKKIEELYLPEQAKQADAKFRILMLGKAAGITKTDAAIEDIFPDEFYIKCVNRAYGLSITKSDLPVDGSDMITKRIAVVLKEKHGRNHLDKRLVMHQLLKEFDTWDKISDLPKGTAKKAEKLFKTINNTFAITKKSD